MSPESRARARAVVSSWHEAGCPDAIATSHGMVRIADIALDGEGTVSIRLAGQPSGTEGHYRVVNPPLLVSDPTGDVVTANNRRYRRDPLAAVAEVIGGLGAAAARRRRRR